MAETQVRVLYDFEGDRDGGELTIQEGQVLVITNQDVGDGWWEGRTASGEVGLFPETYAELMAGAEPDPPPAAPAIQVQVEEPPPEYEYQQQEAAGNEYRDRSESWDDTGEWDEGPVETPPSASSSLSPSTAYDGANADGSSLQRNRSESSVARSGTIRRNINRFSTFVKSGGEAYLLGETKQKAGGGEELGFFQSAEGPRWNPTEAFTLHVTEPTKKSKLKGIKSFIAYTISMSTGGVVERRYKHFDWLHDRLVEKFTLLAVPPLPDKQYAGRYGEDFIEKRRERLEMWLNRVARHPVISHSQVYQHFLTCTDEKTWKVGKRRAEKDELVGSAFFLTVKLAPDLNISQSEQEVEHFGRFVKSMDTNMVQLKSRCNEHCEYHSGVMTKEYQKIGLTFTKLSETFAMEDKDYAMPITDAFVQTGKTYDSIARRYEEQPKNDLLPLLDVIREYLGTLSTYPDIVDVHKESTQKITQCRKMEEEEKMASTDVQQIAERGSVISASVLAEINHFHSERVVDLKAAMQNFLQAQISFHENVIGDLRDALLKYEQC